MEQKQNSVNDGVLVTIPDTSKSYEIVKLGHAQLVKVCRLLLKRKDYNADDPLAVIVTDDKLACKVAAAIVLRGFFTMRLKWWWLWRWFYYVRQYEAEQLMPLLSAGIEALPYSDAVETFSLLNSQRDILLHMTMAEVQKTMEANPLFGKLSKSDQEPTDSEKE